jgi:hypothetical protein
MASKTDFSRWGKERSILKLASQDPAVPLTPFPRREKKRHKEIKEVNCDGPSEMRRERAGTFATCREKSKQPSCPLF